MSEWTLVTGAAGFVGRHLAAALVRSGERVRGLDLSFDPTVPDIECMVGSVTDPDSVAEAMEGVTSVFHCAAIPHLWSPDPDAFERVNVEGTRIVLETARQSGATRAVHVSSFVTLMSSRNAGQTVDETTTLRASDMLGAYPLSKFRSENLALSLAREGFKVVAALPSAPVGPLDYHLTPPTKLLRDLIRGRVPATLKCRMNLIDVRALAQGLIAARNVGRSGERYLLTGEDLSMQEFLTQVEGVCDVPMPRRIVPGVIAQIAARIDEGVVSRMTGRAPGALLTGVRLARTGIRFDNSRARTELGLQVPPLRAALTDALDWMREVGLLEHFTVSRKQ